MNTALIVPTNRPEQLQEFLDAWQPYADWNLIIVVEDAPEKTPGFDQRVAHYSWKEIDQELGDKAWIISRKDSAIRSYGFLLAHAMGCEYIATLDDDCRPIISPTGESQGFMQAHIASMNSHKRWVSSVPDIRQRGLPYRNTGKLETVICNVGLWSGVPDQDSTQALQYPIDDYKPRSGSFLVPAHQYTPMCGMNLCFMGEATPLFYFGLQGQGYPYSRFDDIWCGIIAKKVIDYLGCHMSVGEPHILHQQASNPFANLIREAAGIGANEVFWEAIDQIELKGSSPLECMAEVGAELSHWEDYMGKLGEAILIWTGLFHADKP